MYKLTFVFFISFLSMSALSDTFDISINFESGYEFKSQIVLAQEIRKLKSKKEIEKLIRNQDWIDEYSLVSQPFKNKILISIKNKIPIFALNGTHFYDDNLNKFNFDYTYGEIIHVEGPVQDFETILKLINLVQSDTFRVNKILFSYTNGWDIVSKDTKIRFGKNITNKKLRNFKNTINYLLDIEKIPSIIDLRNKDGVALNYGSK